MERLTERNEYGVYYPYCDSAKGCGGHCASCEFERKIAKKLAKYEDAEEQGLLLRLPCKVGDVVYFPKYDYHDSAIITRIEIDKEGITFYWDQYEYGVDITELWDDGCFSIDEIGKTVFLTREEAEKALKQMKGE